MKLYVRLISLSAALAAVFIVGGFSGFLVTETEIFHISPFIPSDTVFECVWTLIYLLVIGILTSTIATKCLRCALPFWGALAAAHVAFSFAFFVLRLYILGLTLIFLSLAVLIYLLYFYAKNTRLLWLALTPLCAWYIYCGFMISLLIING